ncbi:MAG: glycerophosphodiester phosphodiesterase family protein [Bacteroidota bacterium]|nr:glycerophosphodiester phosphodiesterase family protein [Bacteroidota bacterium]
MKNACLFLVVFSLFAISFLSAKPKVIAHRGYWNCEGSAQNSLASLNKAHALNGIYGSELDVYITMDGVVVVNHNPDIEGHVIETSRYNDIKKFLLSNGERLPTFEKYLKQAKKNKERLIVELKEHNINPAVNEKRVVEAVLKLVKKHRMENFVEYISFSLNECALLKAADSTVKVSYLPRKVLSPEQVKSKGLDGIDYSEELFNEHPEWIKEAQGLGLTVNVYTPSAKEALQKYIDIGVDFITTDAPELLLNMLRDK